MTDVLLTLAFANHRSLKGLVIPHQRQLHSPASRRVPLVRSYNSE
jgi:hypothetical protein